MQKKKASNPFIEVEAALSDEGSCSSDESEGSSLDDMDDSFIYSQSQCSQQDPDGTLSSDFIHLSPSVVLTRINMGTTLLIMAVSTSSSGSHISL